MGTLVTGAPRLTVRADPALAETAVRAALVSLAARRPDAVAVHRRRAEPIYGIADERERDRAFGRLALAEFEELGLADPIVGAVRERPALAARVTVLLVGEASRRLEEGVTCDAGGDAFGVRIAPERFGDPDRLRGWARHALGHAEDTLDPAFGFVAGWEETADGRRLPAAVQARLHRLWDVTLDARLAAVGRLDGGGALTDHRARLAADLGEPGEEALAAVVARLWSGPRPTFPELLAWASRPGDLLRAAAPAAARPRLDRCPLCRFPGDDVRPPDPALAAAVAADYPAWDPADGLCGRCADRYLLAGRLGGAA